MEHKKKINYFKLIIITLFIIYMFLYTLSISGYYEGTLRKRVAFTNEQIKEFESDIQNGLEVDTKDYLEELDKDYTNNISRLGYEISTSIDTFLNRGIKDFFKLLSKFFS